MRKRTELEMQNEEYLSNKGIAFVTIVLTANILSHSIFDANRQIVKYLKEQGIHDYASQEKGKSAKVLIDTHILSFKEEVFSKSSLYKTGTRGDKRMWFGAEVLPYAEEGNVFVIIAHEGKLYVWTESKIDVELCYNMGADNPIKRFMKIAMLRK